MIWNPRIRSALTALTLAMAAAFLFTACAGGGTTGGGAQSCQSDIDCPLLNSAGEALSCYENKCLTDEEIANRGGGGNDAGTDTGTTEDTGGDEDSGTPDDTGSDNDTGGDTGTDDTGNTDAGDDTSTSGCNPQCGPSEFCNNNNVCEEIPTGGDCASQGDACDANTLDQGNFWCVSTNSGGVCVLKCDTILTASGCSVGEYCRNVGTQTQERLGCVPSDCSADADCSGGTCLDFDNQYGLCVPAGSLAPGDSCTVGGSQTCQQGYFCRRLQQGSDAGVCASLCQPWSSTTGCPSGQYCRLFTSREGICTDQVESPPLPAYNQNTCTAGNMCSDAVQCFGDSTSTTCYKYCRSGESDCTGLTFNGQSVPSTCNNYVAAGERSYGLCLPTCSEADDCCSSPPCTDSQCLQGKCRNTCSTGNEVQDCCGGSTPCDFTCVNGLCE